MGRIDDIKGRLVNFTCHRTVKAGPMSKAEYARLREYVEPETDEPGWLVIHEDGYISWSPEEVFRKDYRLSERFKDRLKNEMIDLEEKIKKLEDFLVNDKAVDIDPIQVGLMITQLSSMQSYYSTLKTRYNLLTQTK